MLDNPIRFSDVELKSAFKNVDDVIDECVVAGDPRKAIALGRSIIKDGALRGLALARLLYELQEKWPTFVAAGVDDDFYSVIESEMGYKPATVDKYARMWESVFENENIPADIKTKLMGRPMNDLLLLTGAAREGSLSEDELREAADSPDKESLKEIIRTARGKQTNSESAVVLTISMRDGGKVPAGVIMAKRGNERVTVGNLHIASDDELVQKAVARILRAAGIVEVK